VREGRGRCSALIYIHTRSLVLVLPPNVRIIIEVLKYQRLCGCRVSVQAGFVVSMRRNED
jgi:hypothetical protein